MSWLRTANAVLEKSTGLRLAKAHPSPADRPAGTSGGTVAESARPPADPEHDRLLKAPVFIFSCPRSGSTLLRVLLNSHSQLYAPHETHIRTLYVRQPSRTGVRAMKAFGHNRADIEHLLWDRVLHRELTRSGKPTLVEKTPSNVFVSDRLATCWPDARFLTLLRHPCSVARSWHEADPEKRPMERAVPHALKYAEAVERTRQRHDTLTVRYEDLTEDPEQETRRICTFLGVPWEEGMLDYGTDGHGSFSKGLGDWRDKIRTGSVQRGRPLPTIEETPEMLRPIARTWGYSD
ncbi:sulfotransferase family protein [Streptomyces sp. TR06-5]|uniref:sulfotransferase family protein n=1 Tax=unclassified Streptomyces TaxID=2593676 RepID=UPI0039A05CE8